MIGAASDNAVVDDTAVESEADTDVTVGKLKDNVEPSTEAAELILETGEVVTIAPEDTATTAAVGLGELERLCVPEEDGAADGSV